MKTIDLSFDFSETCLEQWMEEVASLDEDQLEALTVKAIMEHRRLTDEAEAAYQDCQAARGQLGYDSLSLKETYRNLMQRNHTQIMVVSALTDRLGRIPDLPPGLAIVEE